MNITDLSYKAAFNESPFLALSLLLAILVSSCSTVKQAKRDLTDYFSILKNRQIENYTASCTFGIKVPKLEQSVTLKIRLSRTDSISINMTGPFGISLGKMFATKDYFLFYSTFEGIAYEGNPNTENIDNTLHLPVSFSDLFSILRNEAVFEPENYYQAIRTSHSSPLHDAGSAALVYKKDDMEDIAFINKNFLVKYERKSISGDIIFNVQYEKFIDIDGIPFPETMIITIPKNNSIFTLEFDNIEFNRNIIEPYSFILPDDIPKKVMK